jgi:integrase/recombinase XerD
MKVSEGVGPYLAKRRAAGLIFERPEALIAGFCRHVGDIQFSQLEIKHVVTYLDAANTSTITWRTKYQMLLRFLEFWFYRGAMRDLLMPPPKPPERQTFVPYVYSRAELRALLKAVAQDQHKRDRALDRQTLRTMILLLYGTGARMGEIINLPHDDVDLKGRLITISHPNSARSRSIPIGPDLCDVLSKYLSWRSRKNFQSAYLFITKSDTPVSRGRMTVAFQRLRTLAKVTRGDGTQQQPRLDDLRYTFAVHRITSWIRNGADLDRMLPAMAAYMGQMGLGATERYVAMTPERFRRALNKLSPTHSRHKWRNDPALMKFLTSL